MLATSVRRIEDTSTQVELGFTAALAAEGLLAGVDGRHDDWLVNISDDEQARPVLLAVSDNGIQMTSGSTRGFMALCAIAQHFGRPGTPTDQASIESVNGHIKLEYPHLLATADPATLRTEIALTATAKGSTGKSATPPTPEKATATRAPMPSRFGACSGFDPRHSPQRRGSGQTMHPSGPHTAPPPTTVTA